MVNAVTVNDIAAVGKTSAVHLFVGSVDCFIM
jgi:hypothetical protein